MKKLLASILCLCLIVTMLPVTALAEGETINGHEPMYAVDGVLSEGITSNPVTDSNTTSYVGWFIEGRSITFENVSLTDAAYLKYYARLDSSATENAVVNVYLDSTENTPVGVLTLKPDGAFLMHTAALTQSITGTHNVILVSQKQAGPDFSYVQFVTASEGVVNGHDRMYMTDGRVTGNWGATTNDGNTLAPTNIGWTTVGTAAAFDCVSVNNASYAELCLISYAENTVVGIYLDDETTPVGEFRVGTNNTAYYTEKIQLSETVSGMHTVTVRITGTDGSGPNLSWVKLMTEDEAFINGHERILAASGSVSGGGIGTGDGTELAPSHVGWINPGSTITFEDVRLTGASYVKIYTRLNPEATTDGIFEIYLNDEETPAATITAPRGSNFVGNMAALNTTRTGIYKVTVALTQASPDIAWVQFLTEDEAFINGHARMYAVDGVRGGDPYPGINDNAGDLLAPSFVDWFNVGSLLTFEDVRISNASYIKFCGRSYNAESAAIDIYLDSVADENLLTTLEFPVDGTFREYLATLNTPLTGAHDIILAPQMADHHFSWIRFATEEEATMNGNDRMYVTDGVLAGAYGVVTDEINPLTPTYIGWTNNTTTVTYEYVKITDATYAQLCLKSFSDATTVSVYLDEETDPVATFTPATNTEWHLSAVELSKEVSGVHTVTLKIEAEGPDISWLKFATEEDVKGTPRNGHERMMAAEADSRSFTPDKIVYNENSIAPTSIGWISAGDYATYDYVGINNAKYVQLCTEAHSIPEEGSNRVDILVGESETPVASFEFGIDKSKHIRTLALEEALTEKDSVTMKIVAGSPSFSWVRFLTQEEYDAFLNLPSVALVGDSNVEFGYYSNGMSMLLDFEEYWLQSFGHSGAMVRGYQDTDAYQRAIAAAADYYIITLGTNDAVMDEAGIQNDTGTYYRQLIDNIRAANPDAKIYAQTPLPLADPTTTDRDGRTEEKIALIIEAIRAACAEKNVPVIDIHEGMLSSGFLRTQYLSDHVHVNHAGGKIMAKLTYDAIFAEGYGEGEAPGTVDAVTITVPEGKTELTEKGETIALTADPADVYWEVRNMEDDKASTFAAIDENGVLTALKPGAYRVVAISKADTSVTAEVEFYNSFAYAAADVDYIFASYGKSTSGDVLDGGMRVSGLKDGDSFYLKDVDLSAATSFTVRAATIFRTTNTEIVNQWDIDAMPLTDLDSTLELHLDSPDGPMIAKSTIGSTKLVSSETWDLRYGDFKSTMVPVTDGALHDVYAVVNYPETGTDVKYISFDILSLEFGTEEEKTPAVVKDNEVVDIFSPNFEWEAGEYSFHSRSESLPIAALYDEDGKVITSAILSEEGGVREAGFTLSGDVSGADLRTFHWKDLASMQPVTPEYMTYQAPITVGCVGDSITKFRNEDDGFDDMLSYPKFLGLALGSRYKVQNFGIGSRTAGEYDEYAYRETQAYQDALAAKCDIYVIQLGNNDCKYDDETFNAGFEAGYQRLIDDFKAANPNCEIYLTLPFPSIGSAGGINSDRQRDLMVPAVQKLAEDNGFAVIDVYNWVVHEVSENDRMSEIFLSDQIHPSAAGMANIAELVKDVLLAE